MLNKLLWKDKNKWQIAGATLGGFIGLFLLLFSMQIWFDLQQLMNGGSDSDEFVTINKKVTLLNTLGIKPSFSNKELQDIAAQPNIQSVGPFIPNQFKVSASSKMLGFYTELFFESLPDEFIDVQSSQWNWEPGQTELPIIMSRDYLALYNFGFALSQGLPQFTAGTIGKVTVDINIYGNGKTQTFQGRIIGFSDRINSILVPKNFMDFANQQFGEEPAGNPSRLILKVDNPYHKKFTEYLEKHQYEVSSGRLIGGRTAVLINTLISIIAVIGGIIMLLSVLVFVLNFQLIISKSADNIRLLLQIGYKHGVISRFLSVQWLILFSFVVILTLFTLIGSRYWIVLYFSAQGLNLSAGLHVWVYTTAAILISSIALFNIVNIRRSVLALFN